MRQRRQSSESRADRVEDREEPRLQTYDGEARGRKFTYDVTTAKQHQALRRLMILDQLTRYQHREHTFEAANLRRKSQASFQKHTKDGTNGACNPDRSRTYDRGR
jgi:hypothetical protein